MAESGRKALVVDDTSIMRMILTKILSGRGFAITEATNGAEAIKAYFTSRPDIVLMDLMMDPIDGTTAMRGILHIDPDARIVICSSTRDTHIVTSLLKLGAKGYVTKPFTPEKLLQTVDAALSD